VFLQYGLYSSFLGCYIYSILGTRKEVSIGPTVVGAVLMAPYVTKFGASIVQLISFFAGIIIAAGALLKLGITLFFFYVALMYTPPV
jgi:sodium-independent sulfate anion transporter 11